MKLLSEKKALEKLHQVKADFQNLIPVGYEHKAKDCLTCETKGACCLDAHFVNVHITRLEAKAIKDRLEKLSTEKQAAVYRRIEETISKYGLFAEGDTFAQTYACPLFEKEIGCLVHEYGKPLPCIQHACYEQKEDLPPDELLTEQEGLVERLNDRTYGKKAQWLPLPVAVRQKHDR
jgi:hypothetical protein